MAKDREESNSDPERLDELQLTRFLENRLDAAEQAEVEARLQKSSEDRRALDALREESRLLREAAENLAEPPLKIGEKVITILRAEHRRRVGLERARRFRSRLIAITATAALLMIGLYFLSPRAESARILSGTSASVVRNGGAPVLLLKGGQLYDDDVLITARGQFVRLELSSTCQVDVDEDSRVRIEKGAASLISVESGRARISTNGVNHSVLVRTPFGHVRADQDAEFEFWLATPREVRWPSWTEPWTPNKLDKKEAPPAAMLACLTVFKGSAQILTKDHPKGFPVGTGQRVTFTGDRVPVSQQNFGDWEALDSRREPWHTLDGVAPPGVPLLEIFPPFDWKGLGEQTGLFSSLASGSANVTASIKDAFDTLAKAQSLEDAAARAAQLSRGQQALRAAAQGLPLSSELRWIGRTIEGLAHFERGRCLQSLVGEQASNDAAGAFLAASVAFHEALAGSQKDLKNDANVAPGLGSFPAPSLTVSSRLRELTPVEQGMLLARFYLPWALRANTRLAWKDDETEPLPPLFEQAAAVLDVSVEGLASRYGRALALADEGRVNEALQILAGIRSYSVAGLSDTVRAHIEGLRQAAHVASVRIHADRGEWEQARAIMDMFRARYPLSTDGSAERRMEDIQAQGLRTTADAAYQQEDWLTALHHYDALLREPGAEARLTSATYWVLRLKQLEAAVGAGKGAEAAHLAGLVTRDGAAHLSAADLARAKELAKRAEELLLRQREEDKPRTPDGIQQDTTK